MKLEIEFLMGPLDSTVYFLLKGIPNKLRMGVVAAEGITLEYHF